MKDSKKLDLESPSETESHVTLFSFRNIEASICETKLIIGKSVVDFKVSGSILIRSNFSILLGFCIFSSFSISH